MNYTKLAIHLAPFSEEVSEVFQAALGEIGFEVFEDTNDGFDAYIQTATLQSEQTPQLFEERFAEIIELMGENFSNVQMTYKISDVDNADWNSTWEEESFTPINIDDKIYIHSPRYEAMAVETDIVVEPQLAFGSGHHETTCLMIRNMLSVKLEGARVLDVGCGTGILSFVAAKRGSRDIVAIDIDEASVENTRHNAHLNNINNINIYKGTVDEMPQLGAYDLVLANIMRNVLVHDMPYYSDALTSGGHLIVSGFYSADSFTVENEAQKFNLTPLCKLSDNDWVSIIFKKR